jgi:hypothetical protein
MPEMHRRVVSPEPWEVLNFPIPFSSQRHAAAARVTECLAASVSLRRSMLPSPHEGRLGLGGSRFEASSAFTFVTARGLVHHPKDGFVDRLSGFRFLPPCYPSYRALAFALVRLFLTEYASLLWTHQHAGLSRRSPNRRPSARHLYWDRRTDPSLLGYRLGQMGL